MSDDGPEESIQERLERSMPTLPEERMDISPRDGPDMTTDEHREVHDVIEGFVQRLYYQGFSPNELGVIFNGFGHRMNAARTDPYEYDRIALTINLRETLQEWRDEQDHEVPEIEIAEVFEEMGRLYRSRARREMYQGEDDG